MTLLQTVGLAQVADPRVSSLDRLQKRRLNIAVELLGNPGLLVLDAPTEQLTPFEEVQISILLKELSRTGLHDYPGRSACEKRGDGGQDHFFSTGRSISLVWTY